MRSWASEEEPKEYEGNIAFKSRVKAMAVAAGIKDPVKLVAIEEAAFTAAAGIVIDRLGIVGTVRGDDAPKEPTRSEQALSTLDDKLTQIGIANQKIRKKIADFATQQCESIQFPLGF